MRRLFVSLFLCVNVWASDPPAFRVELTHSLASRSCASELQTYLYRLAPQLVQGTLTDMRVVAWRDLEEEFKRMNRGGDIRLKLEKFLAHDHSAHGYAGSVVRYLAQMKTQAQGDLVFCILNEGCRPIVGHAAHYRVRALRYATQHFRGEMSEAAKGTLNIGGAEEGIPQDLLRQFPNTIFLNEIPHSDFHPRTPGEWVSNVLHEITHDHDAQLLDDWVTANLWRRQEGQEVDSLFADDRIVRTSTLTDHPEIAVELDLAFYILFMESRGFGMSIYADTLLFPLKEKDRKESEKKARSFARTRIRELGGEGAFMKNGFAFYPSIIGEKNIFEFGVAAGTFMNTTIQSYRDANP